MSASVSFTKIIQKEWKDLELSIRHQMVSRAYRSANELRNASQLVLRGQRHGRIYTVPGTGSMKYNKKTHKATITYKKYTASAPGEPPAVRTGAFRMSWRPKVYIDYTGDHYTAISQVESTQRTDNGTHLLGEVLEYGTSRMAPRPHHQAIQSKALPKILKIYNEPYV